MLEYCEMTLRKRQDVPWTRPVEADQWEKTLDFNMWWKQEIGLFSDPTPTEEGGAQLFTIFAISLYHRIIV